MQSSRAQILFVEDSSVYREMQGLLLEKAGFVVSAHEHPRSALEAASQQQFDLVVLDYELPEMNGQQFMLQLRTMQPDIAVVFVSGVLTLDLAIQLTSQGVAGIFNKPANPKILLERINETIFRHTLREAVPAGSRPRTGMSRRAAAHSPFRSVPQHLPEPSPDQCAYTPQHVLGKSDAFRDFTHRLWKVRDFRSVLLLQGEPGSPFELFARELVDVSQYRNGPVMVCRATTFDPRSVIEVLAPCLLSHDAGTLIVTGVERFTAAQQKTLENLVTSRDVFVPFARRFRLLLAATDELAARVEEGAFSETLFYKIGALSLTVPNLRAMADDIPANALQILAQVRAELNSDTPVELTPEAAALLAAQPWPGNYAQLAETIRSAAQRSVGQDALPVESIYGFVPRIPPVHVDTLQGFGVFSSESKANTASVFRPSSSQYRFAQRLSHALARTMSTAAG